MIKNVTKKKGILSIAACAAAAAFCFGGLWAPETAYGYNLPDPAKMAEEALKNAQKEGLTPGTDWTVAVYLCGTNLESFGGSASEDISEMLSATIPDNVNVLLLTGGTAEWQDPEVEGYVKPSNDHTQIWQVTDERMIKLYDYSDYLNLSDSSTISSFLEFAVEYAPAEHMMVDFWDHGGGPIDGAINAENPDSDDMEREEILVNEFEKELNTVNQYRQEKIPGIGNLDIVSYDCCLMGNAEIAYALSGSADYFIGSEEVEPGTGWNYNFLSVFSEDGFFEQSAEDQSISIGKRVIDLYPGDTDPANAEETWTNGDVYELTLALVDLSRMDKVAEAANNLGAVLGRIYENPEEYSKVARAIENIPQIFYGEIGVSDIYHLSKAISDANISGDLTSAANALIEAAGKAPAAVENKGQLGPALNEEAAVLYRGLTSEYAGGIGLSIFHPIGSDVDPHALENAMEGGIYQGLSMVKRAPYYGNYASDLATRQDKKNFDGKITTEWDDENNLIYMGIKKGKIGRIATVLAEISATEGETEYRLGSMKANYNQELDRYEVPEMQRWMSFDDVPFTYDVYDVNGVRMYEIPIYEETGTAEKYHEGDVVQEKDIVKLLAIEENGYTRIYSVFAQGTDRTRILTPEETISFHPLRFRTDGENGEYVANKLVTVEPEILPDREDAPAIHILHAQFSRPSSDDDYLAGFVFKAYDWNYNVYYSDPMAIVEFNLNKLVLDPVWAQEYTGKPITPEPVFSYPDIESMNTEIVESWFGVYVKTEYSNNVNRGTATMTVTLTDKAVGDVLRTLTQDFIIVSDEDAEVTTEETQDGDNKVITTKVMYADGSGTITQETIYADGSSHSVCSYVSGMGKTLSITTTDKDKAGLYAIAEYLPENQILDLVRYETNQKSAYIPATVTDCNQVEYSVTAVYGGAFDGAKSVKTVTIDAGLTFVEKNAFKGISKKPTIKIRAKKKAYKNMVKMIKKSGVPKKTKFKRIK